MRGVYILEEKRWEGLSKIEQRAPLSMRGVYILVEKAPSPIP
jgi:hypothetical protein